MSNFRVDRLTSNETNTTNVLFVGVHLNLFEFAVKFQRFEEISGKLSMIRMKLIDANEFNRPMKGSLIVTSKNISFFFERICR